ncbi:ras-related protein RABC2a isoform X2 [Gossypium hirsutum]|uniref:Ras-related protein RABC2a isoform X2 n=1 Tax=Gossypium hirsutum TaxID=3635 RepID=A0ABM3B2G8_GOSHI|nr:ras-related protein RABC2a isoform X2 [Gossypium hirsutum]
MGSSSEQQSSENYDFTFKILSIGDSGVGKTSLIASFISAFSQYSAPTIGVDFKIKFLTVGGKRLKLTIWDTAYDVTRRETFTNLSDVWAKEVELYSTNQDCVKILVGNKIDRESERAVSKEEGIELAKELGCTFIECSAKTGQNVQQCFEDLSLKIMEVRSLLEKGSTGGKGHILKPQPAGNPGPGLRRPGPPPDCCA